jgi:hypothetical protein
MQDQLVGMINQLTMAVATRGTDHLTAQSIAGDIVEEFVDYSDTLSKKYNTNRGMVLNALVNVANNYLIRGANVGTAINDAKENVEKMLSRADSITKKLTSTE